MWTHPAWLLVTVFAIALQAGSRQQSDDAIVVTGTKSSKDAIAHYVDRITAEVDGQIATFRKPICPASFGLPSSYNRAIESRIRQDALEVGVRTATVNCDPNVIIIVADGSGSLVDRLRKQRPDIFAGLNFAQMMDVVRTKGPVRTWQSVEPHGADGRPLERVSFVDWGTGHLQYIGESYHLRGTTALSSRITNPVRQDLVRSFVLLEVNAVDGLTLTQIADYAAMRALARTRAPTSGGSPTILGLFDTLPAAGAAQLTRWDLAYLRALYATDNSLSVRAQQSAMIGAIRRDLEKSEEP